MESQELLDKLISLQTNYQNVLRTAFTANRFTSYPCEPYDLEDTQYREPLLEHVGHLPIIATFLYPYLENREHVNLGETLAILAVHDIGETIEGDIFHFNKSNVQEEEESSAAKRILDKMYHEFINAFEKLDTNEAKFAYSVDKIAPKLHHISMPNEHLKKYFAHYNFSPMKIRDKQIQFYEWDGFLKGFFLGIIDRLESKAT